MNLLPGMFRDPATGKAVRACVFAHNENVGETAADDCVVTIPASARELVDIPAQSLTGLWPAKDFEKRFKQL